MKLKTLFVIGMALAAMGALGASISTIIVSKATAAQPDPLADIRGWVVPQTTDELVKFFRGLTRAPFQPAHQLNRPASQPKEKKEPRK